MALALNSQEVLMGHFKKKNEPKPIYIFENNSVLFQISVYLNSVANVITKKDYGFLPFAHHWYKFSKSNISLQVETIHYDTYKFTPLKVLCNRSQIKTSNVYNKDNHFDLKFFIE